MFGMEQTYEISSKLLILLSLRANLPWTNVLITDYYKMMFQMDQITKRLIHTYFFSFVSVIIALKTFTRFVFNFIHVNWSFFYWNDVSLNLFTSIQFLRIPYAVAINFAGYYTFYNFSTFSLTIIISVWAKKIRTTKHFLSDKLLFSAFFYLIFF